MRKNLFIAAAIAALSPLASHAQQSQETNWLDMGEVHGTVGLRLMGMDWTSWFTTNGTPVAVEYLKADKEVTVTPVVSLRYQNFLVSASYMLNHDFNYPIPNYPQTERKEYDINLGYFILPGLAASVGYKNIKYDTSDGQYRWEAKGPTLGLSGSAPLAAYTSLYGNFAYGWPKLNDNFAFNDKKGKYLLSEVGLAFPLGALTPSMNGFVATLGYRYQRVGAVANGNASVAGRELYETSQGAVLGFSYSM